MDWKNNKRIHVAVGLAIVLLAVRWLFSPTLQDAALAYSTPEPADGNVGNPITGLALLWPVLDFVLALAAGIGAYAINLGDRLWMHVQGGTAESRSLPASPDKLQRDLIQAIASNDIAARKRLEPMVRGPEAIAELNAAVGEGDFDTAESKLAEIKKLAAQVDKAEAKQ